MTEKRRVRIADVKADPGYRQDAGRTVVEQLARAMEPTALRAALARLYAAAGEFYPGDLHSAEAEAEFAGAISEAHKLLEAQTPNPTPTSPIQVNERDGDLFILDGWARLKALEQLGVEHVDVEVDRLTRKEEMERWIALNTPRR